MSNVGSVFILRRVARTGALAVLAGVLAGCVQAPFPHRPSSEVLSMVNRDVVPVPMFRAKHGSMTAKLPDETGRVRHIVLTGVNVVFVAPRGLYLSGSYIGQPALRIGSNDEKYWVGVIPKLNELSWGYWKYADRPCNEARMAAPTRLTEVLGQLRITDMSGTYLGPVLQDRPPHHVLMYMAVDEKGNWYVAREILLSDVNDKVQPVKIVYYDAEGGVEMSVEMGDYRAVTYDGKTAYVAGHLELSVPKKDATMKLDLGKVEVLDKPMNFEMPDPSTFGNVKRFDGECGN